MKMTRIPILALLFALMTGGLFAQTIELRKAEGATNPSFIQIGATTTTLMQFELEAVNGSNTILNMLNVTANEMPGPMEYLDSAYLYIDGVHVATGFPSSMEIMFDSIGYVLEAGFPVLVEVKVDVSTSMQAEWLSFHVAPMGVQDHNYIQAQGYEVYTDGMIRFNTGDGKIESLETYVFYSSSMGGYVFGMDIESLEPYNFTFTTDMMYYIPFQEDGHTHYSYEQVFPTYTDLQTAFPNGSYVLDNGYFTVSFDVSHFDFTTAPSFINYTSGDTGMPTYEPFFSWTTAPGVLGYWFEIWSWDERTDYEAFIPSTATVHSVDMTVSFSNDMLHYVDVFSVADEGSKQLVLNGDQINYTTGVYAIDMPNMEVYTDLTMSMNAPDKIKAYPTSATSIGIEWMDRSFSEESYYLKLSTEGEYGMYSTVATLPANTVYHELTGLNENAEYWLYPVAFRSGYGEGDSPMNKVQAFPSASPTLMGTTPVNGEMAHPIDQPLQLVFSTDITGHGSYESYDIELRDFASDDLIEGLHIHDMGSVNFMGQTAQINFSTSLNVGQQYYILITTGSFVNFYGARFAGIHDKSVWNFTTTEASGMGAGGNSMVELMSVEPYQNETWYPVGGNLVMYFNEDVNPAMGDVLIYRSSDDSLFESMPTGDMQYFGNQVVWDPIADLEPDTNYYVLITSGAFQGVSSGTYFAGITMPGQWAFSTGDGAGMPTNDVYVTGSYPMDDAMGVDLSQDLWLNFSTPVIPGVGSVQIIETSSMSPIVSFNSSSSPELILSTDGMSLSIQHPVFSEGTDYYVIISSGAYQSLATGEPWPGIEDSSLWNFVTMAGSGGGVPTVTSLFPFIGETGVGKYNSLTMYFDQDVVAGIGTIDVRRWADDSVFASLDVTNSMDVYVSGNSATIYMPSMGFEALTEYYVMVPNGSFRSSYDMTAYDGNLPGSDWRFTSADSEPMVVSKYPVMGGSVGLDDQLWLEFDTPVELAPIGNITIYRQMDYSVFEQIPVTDNMRVYASTNVVYINPTASLVDGEAYYVTIDMDAVRKQGGGLGWYGYMSPSEWSFAGGTGGGGGSPMVVATTPTNGYFAHPIDELVTIVFDQEMKLGMGNMYVMPLSGSTPLATLDMGNNVLVSGDHVFITLPETVPLYSHIWIKADSGALVSMFGSEPWTGWSDSSGLNFETSDPVGGGGGSAPNLMQTTPFNGDMSHPDYEPLFMVFDNMVVAGSGFVQIRDYSDDSIVDTIDVNGMNVTWYGSMVQIMPTVQLMEGIQYYVTVDSEAIVDQSSGTPWPGISDKMAWNFSVMSSGGGSMGFYLMNQYPMPGSSVPMDGILSLSFSEDIRRSTGNITIMRSDFTQFESMNMFDPRVTVNKNQLFIDPNNSFAQGDSYFVLITSGAIVNAGETDSFMGFQDEWGWDFYSQPDGDGGVSEILMGYRYVSGQGYAFFLSVEGVNMYEGAFAIPSGQSYMLRGDNDEYSAGGSMGNYHMFFESDELMGYATSYINLTESFPAGNYQVGINGTTATVSFSPVEYTNAPTIVSPSNGATGVNLQPTIEWSFTPSGGEVELAVMLEDRTDGNFFESPGLSLSRTTWESPMQLRESATYQVEVESRVFVSSTAGNFGGYDEFKAMSVAVAAGESLFETTLIPTTVTIAEDNAFNPGNVLQAYNSQRLIYTFQLQSDGGTRTIDNMFLSQTGVDLTQYLWNAKMMVNGEFAAEGIILSTGIYFSTPMTWDGRVKVDTNPILVGVAVDVSDLMVGGGTASFGLDVGSGLNFVEATTKSGTLMNREFTFEEQFFQDAPNVTDLKYEVYVTTRHGGNDLGKIASGETPTWQVFIAPQVSAGDMGFDQVRIELPTWLDSTFPSSITVSTSTRLQVSDNSNWTIFPKSSGTTTNYFVDETDPNIIKLTFMETMKSSTDVLIISFKKKVSDYPDFMNVQVAVDNQSNFNMFYGWVGSADGYPFNRNDSGFAVEGSYAINMPASAFEADIKVTPQTPFTNSSITMQGIFRVNIMGGDAGFNQMKLFIPWDLQNVSVDSVQIGATYATASSAGPAGGYTITKDTAIGEYTLNFASAHTASNFYLVNLSMDTPDYPFSPILNAEINNTASYNPMYPMGMDLDGDGVVRNSFDIVSDYDTGTASYMLLDEAAVEMVVIPESGNTVVETNTSPTLGIVMQTTNDSAFDGFSAIALRVPPGFGFPTSKESLYIYKHTDLTQLSGSSNRVQPTDYSLIADGDRAIIRFTTVQNSASMSYRIHFSVSAPEFPAYEYIDVSLHNTNNPNQYWPFWANVADVSTLYYSTWSNAIEWDSMSIEVFTPYIDYNTFEPHVWDLRAEINASTSINTDKEVEFTVAMQPDINANGSGITRLGIELPFDFTLNETASVRVTKTTSGGSATVTVQTEFLAASNRLVVKLPEVDTDTTGHFYSVTFRAWTPSFGGMWYFGTAVDNHNSPNMFYGWGTDVDGVANNNRMEVEVFKDFSAIDPNTYEWKPLVENLVVESTPSFATAGTASQKFEVYVRADAPAMPGGQHGFDIMKVYLPYDLTNIRNISFTSSVGDINYSSPWDTRFLMSDPSVIDQSLVVKFKDIQAASSLSYYKITFEADLPDYMMYGSLDVEVNNKDYPQPSMAFAGDASSRTDTWGNWFSVEPAMFYFDKLPLMNFIAETSPASVESGSASTMEVYMVSEMDDGTMNTGFNRIRLMLPWDFGAPTNIKVSSGPSLNNLSQLSEREFLSEVVEKEIRIKLKEDGGAKRSQGVTYYKLSFNSEAPAYPMMAYFDLSIFDTSNPGFDMWPVWEDANGIQGDNESMEVDVVPSAGSTFNYNLLPASRLVAEVNPSTSVSAVYTGTEVRVNIDMKAQFDMNSAGIDRIEAFISPYFTNVSEIALYVGSGEAGNTPANLVQKLDGWLYERDDYGMLKITLTEAIGGANSAPKMIRVSFKAKTGDFPSIEWFDVSVANANTPNFFPEWGNANGILADSNKMEMTIKPNLSNLDQLASSIVAECAFAEINGFSNASGGPIRVSTSATFTYHVYVPNQLGNTIKGIDTIGLHIPYDITSLSNLKVAASTSSAFAEVLNTTDYLSASVDYTVDATDMFDYKIKLLDRGKAKVDPSSSPLWIAVTFTARTPDYPTSLFFDVYLNHKDAKGRLYPNFGGSTAEYNVDGNANDGNSLEIKVRPPVFVDPPAENVGQVFAKITPNETPVSATQTYELVVGSEVLAGMNGYDTVLVMLPPAFKNWSNLKVSKAASLTGAYTSLNFPADYSLNTADKSQVLVKLTTKITDAISLLKFTFDATAPDYVDKAIFDVAVNNSATPKRVYAAWGSLDATGTGMLEVEVQPDWSSYDTAAITEMENALNVSSVRAEVGPKLTTTNTPQRLTVYVQPEFYGTDRGINQIIVDLPYEFGKPSNISLTTGLASANGVLSSTPLVEYAHYTKSATDGKLTITLVETTTDSSLLYAIAFDAQMPKLAGPYYMEVCADNTAYPMPFYAYWDNLNGNADDNGDGIMWGLNDNDTSVTVRPPVVNVNVVKNINTVRAELAKESPGTAGKSGAFSLGVRVGVVSGDSGFDNLVFGLPEGFSKISNLVLVEDGTTLTELEGYEVNTSNPQKVLVEFDSLRTTTKSYTLGFSAQLPAVAKEYRIELFADNSSQPKKVDAVAGDVPSFAGTTRLRFIVKPVVVAPTIPRKMITDMIARVTPNRVVVNNTTDFSLRVLASFQPNDVGFNTLYIEQVEGIQDPTNFSIRHAVVSSTQAYIDGTLSYATRLEYRDYSVTKTENAVLIKFTTPITPATGLMQEINLGFRAKTGSKPGENRIVPGVTLRGATGLDDFSEVFWAKRDKMEIAGRKGDLKVILSPARKSSAELMVAPKVPAKEVLAEITPLNEVYTGVSKHFDLLVKALITAENSGMNQIHFRIPQDFGEPNNINLFTSTDGNSFSQLQNVADYSVASGNDGLKTLNIAPSALNVFTPVAGNTTAIFKVGFNLQMPSFPGYWEYSVSVDNISTPRGVLAMPGDVDGDSMFGLYTYTMPDPAAYNPNAIILGTAKSELAVSVLPRYVSQTITMYLSAEGVTGGVGFDQIELVVPYDFENLANITLSKLDSIEGTTENLMTELVDYTVNTEYNMVRINLTSRAATGATNAFFKVTFDAQTPPFPGWQDFYACFVDTTNYLYTEAFAGDASKLSDSNEMVVEILSDEDATGMGLKPGFYGDAVPAQQLMTDFVCLIRSTSQSEVNFTTTVDVSGGLSPSYTMLIWTTPSFVATDKGFDQMVIELPAGAGTASQFVMYRRSSDGGNIMYFEEFYDYRVNLDQTGQIVITFLDPVTGQRAVVDQTRMKGLEQLLISFNLPLPGELGDHFFDMYVDNSVYPGRYYLDPEFGSRIQTNSFVEHNEDRYGTRFMVIETTNASAGAVVGGVVAEILAEGGEAKLPVGGIRNFTMDFAVSGAGSFSTVDVLLPDEFYGLGGVRVTEGSTVLTEYTDYTVDARYDGTIRVSLTTARSAGTYSVGFTARTPTKTTVSGGTEVTYVFGLKAHNNNVSSDPVFATEGDASATNTRNKLSYAVFGDRQISGVISFVDSSGNPVALVSDTKVNVSLYLFSGSQVSEITDPIPVAVPAGETSVPYSIVAPRDETYKVKVSAYGFSDVWIGDISGIRIANSASKPDQDVNLVAKDAVATGSVAPDYIVPGAPANLTLSFTPTFFSGASDLTKLEISLLELTDATATVSALDATAVRVGGTAATPPTSLSGGILTVDLSGVAVASGTTVEVDLSVRLTDESNRAVKLNALMFTTSDPTEVGKQVVMSGSSPELYLVVGTEPVAFVTDTSLDAVLGLAYSKTLETAGSASTVTFTESGLASAELGLVMDSDGKIHGTPTKVQAGGFPFTVTANYVTAYTSGSITKNFVLYVHRTDFAIFSAEPAAIPTEGGTVTLRGVGFTDGSTITVGESATTATYVDSNTYLVDVPAMTAGMYQVKIQDNLGEALLPGIVNSMYLTVAASTTTEVEMTGGVADEAKPTVLDYDMLGVPGFFQGSLLAILVEAFGEYDVTEWRAFGYDNGYFEMNTVKEKDSRLTPGKAFWKISRKPGKVRFTGITSESLTEYSITLQPNTWTMITNLFSEDVVWSEVKVLATDATLGAVETTIGAADNTYTNVTLWGMNKNAADETKPYVPESLLKSGMGYWVYNKSAEPVVLKLTKPATAQAKAAPALYKPEEALPPEPPELIQGTVRSSGGGGGGGGCLLR